MSTLDKLHTVRLYVLITLFCVLFGAVYEIFSHGVYSYFMIYAFVIPLVLGVLPFLLLALSVARRTPPLAARCLYHFGIAILTVGSLMTGILEIYGTTNPLTVVYWIAGIVFLVAGAAVWLIGGRRGTSRNML